MKSEDVKEIQTFRCELCHHVTDSVTNLEQHTRRDHLEQLAQVERMFHEDNTETMRMLESVPESEFILTPEEITHFGLDWKTHLKICEILNKKNTKETESED